MILADRITCQQIKPIGIYRFQFFHLGPKLLFRYLAIVKHGHQTLVSVFLRERCLLVTRSCIVSLFTELNTFLGIHEIIQAVVRTLTNRKVSRVTYTYTFFGTSLGRNHDHTV